MAFIFAGSMLMLVAKMINPKNFNDVGRSTDDETMRDGAMTDMK